MLSDCRFRMSLRQCPVSPPVFLRVPVSSGLSPSLRLSPDYIRSCPAPSYRARGLCREAARGLTRRSGEEATLPTWTPPHPHPLHGASGEVGLGLPLGLAGGTDCRNMQPRCSSVHPSGHRALDPHPTPLLSAGVSSWVGQAHTGVQQTWRLSFRQETTAGQLDTGIN